MNIRRRRAHSSVVDSGMRSANDDEDPLEPDFPLGDGSVDTDATVICPYCAEDVTVTLDPGSGSSQEYVEDCPVCCQPWQMTVKYAADGTAQVAITAL